MSVQKKNSQTEDEKLLKSLTPEEPNFLHTDPWRVLRIQGEFVEGFDRLADVGAAVTVFGSARTPEDHPQYQAAVELARRLGEQGFNVITGGGPGVMEAANRGGQEAGVRSIGLNIELPFEQNANPYIDEMIEFHYFFARKTMFLKYARAFVIFPGGFGTMDELFESLTLIQTGKMRNFPVVLFDTEYWGGLVSWLREKMESEGKISEGDLDLMLPTDSVDEAVEFIMSSVREEAWRSEQEEKARQGIREALGKR